MPERSRPPVKITVEVLRLSLLSFLVSHSRGQFCQSSNPPTARSLVRAYPAAQLLWTSRPYSLTAPAATLRAGPHPRDIIVEAAAPPVVLGHIHPA